jgi:hypothetical protein
MGTAEEGTLAAAQKVGAVLACRHKAKHVNTDIADDRFAFACKTAAIAAEAALDGLYAIRIPMPTERLDDAGLRVHRCLTDELSLWARGQRAPNLCRGAARTPPAVRGRLGALQPPP